MTDPGAADANRPRERLRPAFKLISGLAAMVAIGTLLLLIPAASTHGLDPSDAAFTSVSALSVTGLSVITPANDLTFLGQIILLLLMQAGGVGYMVLAVTAFRFLGRQVSLADRLALQDSLGLLNPRGIISLLRYVLQTVLLIEAVGAVALWLNWRTFMPDGRAAWYAVFHSVSAFCNASFDLFSGQPGNLVGIPNDNLTLVILGILIVLGGLGIPVLFDLITWRENGITLHTRITVPVVLTLIVVGAMAVFASEAMSEGILTGIPLDQAIVRSYFMSVSARTAGFAMPGYAQIEPSTVVVICSLMFIGCGPASMGGGITTGTFTVMILALVAFARGRDVPVFKGRAIPGEMVRKGAAVLTVSLVLVVLATWLIALTHRQPLRLIAFEVVSAFSTCGLSLGMTSELNGFGRAVIMFVMFWGRLGALTILVALARTDRPRRVHYPEEKILIG